MTRESLKNVHSNAERAALRLLSSRAAGIGDAAVLRHRLDDLLEQVDSVSEQYATALTTLRDNAWSSEELRQLGLTDPPAPSGTGRRRPARPTLSPRTAPAAAPPAAGAPAEPQSTTTA